jgi:hypothetical protein
MRVPASDRWTDGGVSGCSRPDEWRTDRRSVAGCATGKCGRPTWRAGTSRAASGHATSWEGVRPWSACGPDAEGGGRPRRGAHGRAGATTLRRGSVAAQLFHTRPLRACFLPIFEQKCTRWWIWVLLISPPSTTFTKSLGCFSQRILHNQLPNFEYHHIPVNRRCWQLTTFFTNFLSKFEMPICRKVVLLNKLDNFRIGRFWSV